MDNKKPDLHQPVTQENAPMFASVESNPEVRLPNENTPGQKKKKKKEKLKAKNSSPERGIETWFRTASRNLYTRRQIADTKAGMMITINAIIVSVMLGTIYPQLSVNPHFIWALTPMVITNLLSIIFAVFATKPSLANGRFSRESVDNKTACLTTFDDYYHMSLDEYQWAVNEMMKDKDFLYGTLVRDMHRLGIDLARRYKNLRTSYQIFIVGLTISLLSFGSCYFFI